MAVAAAAVVVQAKNTAQYLGFDAGGLGHGQMQWHQAVSQAAAAECSSAGALAWVAQASGPRLQLVSAMNTSLRPARRHNHRDTCPLTNELLLDIFSRVSAADGSFNHAFVCFRWYTLTGASQRAICVREGARMPETLLLRQAARYPAATALTLRRHSLVALSDRLLLELASCLPRLQSLDISEEATVGDNQISTSGVQALLENFPGLRSLVLLGADSYEFRGLDLSASLANGAASLQRLQLSTPSDRGPLPLFLVPRSLPGSFWELKSITSLALRVDLHRLPDSISQLSCLQELVLNGMHLQSLPHHFSKLAALEKLLLHSPVLRHLPPSFPNLPRLAELELSCQELRDLPVDFGALTALQYLDISQCDHLQRAPNSLYSLPRLRVLKAAEALGLGLGILRSLRSLELNCTWIPQSLSTLNDLCTLTLTSLGSPNIPLTFPRLKALTVQCPRLQTPPHGWGLLLSLSELTLCACSSLKELPPWEGLPALQALSVDLCCSLCQLPDLHPLHQLTSLSITNCASLNSLPKSVGHLTRLRTLHLATCKRLRSLPSSLGRCSALEELHVEACPILQLSVKHAALPSLKVLSLIACDQLQGLPSDLDGHSNLRTVTISNCPLLRDCSEFPLLFPGVISVGLQGLHPCRLLPLELSGLHALRSLRISRLRKLERLPCTLCWLPQLTSLQVDNCYDLRGLPEELGTLRRLKELVLSFCPRVHRLPHELGCVVSLRALEVLHMDGLRCLPDTVGKLRLLRRLVVVDCRLIQALPESIGDLRSLQSLVVSGLKPKGFSEKLEGLTALCDLQVRGDNSSLKAYCLPCDCNISGVVRT